MPSGLSRPAHRHARAEADPGPVTTVRLEAREDGGTRLILREDDLPDLVLRAAHSTAWLDRLGRLLGHLATQPYEAGIRRTYRLRSDRERVWRAFTDGRELGAWWGGTGRLDIRPGVAGWWEWPGLGRFAMVIDAVEPMHYLAWRWATVADRLVADADQVLRTEWTMEDATDGGTVLHLLESGFTGPEDHRLNDGGWDGDILPALRSLLGETA